MSRMVLIAAAAAFIAAGCGTVAPERAAVSAGGQEARDAPSPRRNDGRIIVSDEAGKVEVQKVESRPGVSSSTVERLARKAGCTGTEGAGLVTEKGPVEIYRMQCDNGKTFMARCELRQCKPMR
jgi:hypothetical protein